MIRRPPRSTRTTHSVPTRRASDLSQPSLVMGTDAAFGFNASIRGIDSSASGIGTDTPVAFYVDGVYLGRNAGGVFGLRSEEHTSELQSLMSISYAVFCLKKKNKTKQDVESHK